MNNLKDAVGYPYDWQNREEEALIESYWAAHGKNWMTSDQMDVHRRDQVANWRLKFDPWANGRYAVAALVWGIIIMLVLSVQP